MINDSIDAGSQIPVIREAMRNGYAVLLLNQNQTFLEVDGFKVQIRVRVTAVNGAMEVEMGEGKLWPSLFCYKKEEKSTAPGYVVLFCVIL